MMVGSDFHDLLVDRFALSVWNDQLSIRQPDIIAFNGDIFDCPEFGRYPFDPRKWKIKERFAFVKKHIFAEARKRCPDAQIEFIIGNHEWRILKLLALQSPNVRILLSDVMGLSLNDVFGLDDFQINLICKVDLEAFREKDMKDEMQNNYEVYYDAYVLCHKANYGFGMSGSNGHLHTTKIDTDANIPMGNISWMQTPCMHMLDAEYIEGKNNWNLGFGQVYINILTKEVIQTPINIQQDWACINGKVYRRRTHG